MVEMKLFLTEQITSEILAVNMQWKKLIKEITGFSKRTNNSIISLCLKEIVFPLTPNHLKNFQKKILSLLNINAVDIDYKVNLNKKFIRSVGIEAYLNEIKQMTESADTARKYHYFTIDKVSHQNYLEIEDRIASAFHIEPRCPFLDKRLVEFCYAIPNEMKFRFGWNRYLQRIALENILPTEIQWRPLKKFFDQVHEKNLLLFEKDRLEEIIINNNRNIEDYVNLDFIKDTYQKYINENESNDLTNTLNYIDIWLVVILYLWLQNQFPEK